MGDGRWEMGDGRWKMGGARHRPALSVATSCDSGSRMRTIRPAYSIAFRAKSFDLQSQP